MVGTHCVREETLFKRLNHFLYKYITLKTNFNDSSYHRLASELDSIEPPGCRRVDGG